MLDNPKHTKVTEYTPLPDGTIQIHAKSYYEELAHEKIELEKQTIAGRDTILKELLSSLDLVTKDKSLEVNVNIKLDPRHDGWTVVKRWTIEKKNYNHHR